MAEIKLQQTGDSSKKVWQNYLVWKIYNLLERSKKYIFAKKKEN